MSSDEKMSDEHSTILLILPESSSEVDSSVEDSASENENSDLQWYKNIEEDGRLKCKFCELTYISMMSVRAHVQSKHPEEAAVIQTAISKSKRTPRNKCHICDEKFDTLDNLKQHTVQHELQKDKHICGQCGIIFEDEPLLKQHVKQEHARKRKQDNTKKPVKYERRDDNVQCPYCEHVCKRRFSLTNHIKARHKTEDDLKFVCPLCPYKASIKYYLKSHMESNHPQSEAAKSKTKYMCSFCGYSTVKKSHFELHRKMHLKIHEYKCQYCDYETYSSGALKIHVNKMHTQETYYSCDYEDCSFVCLSISDLQNHKLRHDPHTLWHCDKCEFTAPFKSHLMRHAVVHCDSGWMK